MITVPVEVLDAAGLDAEMRAIAEMAASGSEQRAALPPVEMDPAERAMEEQPLIETSDIWIEELPDVPAPCGGGNVTGEALTNGCFALLIDTTDPAGENDEPVRTAHFANRYYNYGNLTLTCADRTLDEGGVIVALKISTTAYQQTPTASIEIYADFQSLQADQHARAYVVIPLYTLDVDFSILCDFRVIPIFPGGEVL